MSRVLIQAVPGDYTKWKIDELERLGKAAARLDLPMAVLWKAMSTLIVYNTQYAQNHSDMRNITKPNDDGSFYCCTRPVPYLISHDGPDGKKKSTDTHTYQLISTLLLKKEGIRQE